MFIITDIRRKHFNVLILSCFIKSRGSIHLKVHRGHDVAGCTTHRKFQEKTIGIIVESVACTQSFKRSQGQRMSQLIIDVNKIKGTVSLSSPKRYRLMGQLSEIHNKYITDGYICELSICNLPEFGNCNSEETLRVIVGEKVYESRFVPKCSNNSETSQNRQRQGQPQQGDAVSVYLGIVHLSGMRKMLEVMDITVLTLAEVRSLRTFIRSSSGSKFLKLSSPQ